MKTQNERFKEIRVSLKLSQGKFAEMSGLSLSTVQKIENQTMEISDKNLQAIEQTLNVNPIYIKTGKTEKFKDGLVPEINLVEKSNSSNPWRDALVTELKEEVTYYRELLKMMAGNKATNFLKAIENARFTEKHFPGKSFNSVRAVA